jgi:putative sigma-54 modulation protein
MLVDKLDRQVIRYKDKVQSHDRESLKYHSLVASQAQQ